MAMTEEELVELAGDPDWCANYDYNHIPGLLATIRELRAALPKPQETPR